MKYPKEILDKASKIKWAKWIAMDDDGTVAVFEHKPELSCGTWHVSINKTKIKILKIGADYETSLTELKPCKKKKSKVSKK